MESEQDKTLYTTDEPDITALADEFKRCTPFAYGWDRVQDNEDTRFCRWNNQSTDGKKHATKDSPAFPWEGASDTRVNLTDSIISEHVALKTNAFQRSIAMLKGVEPKDQETAANIHKLLEWLTTQKVNDELPCEVELSAQYQDTYGNLLLHPTWEREVELKRDNITLQKLAEIAAQNPGSPLELLTQLIANEDTEDQAVALVQEYAAQIVRAHAEQKMKGEYSDLFDNYKLKAKTARKFVKELREGKVSSLPIPYICKNQPSVKALKLWVDAFIPSYVTDIQKAPRIFVRCWYTEHELRAEAALNGWDEDWVEKVVTTQKGRQSTWTASTSVQGQTVYVNSESSFTWTDAENNPEQIEVIWAYTRELDEDDVPSIYYTVFHAEATRTDNGQSPMYAKRAPLNYPHKKMPFVSMPRERWDRSLLSARGIPEVLSARQREVKVQRDALVDMTSLTVSPPILVPSTAPGNTNFKFGPGTVNLVLPGREPKQMELKSPGAQFAFELMERFERDIKEEMGIPHPEIPPERTQVKQQQIINNFLGPWTEAFQQVVPLIIAYMPDDEYTEITGSPKPQTTDIEKDIMLAFDVRSLNIEYMLSEFKAIGENVMPHDREGVISSQKFVRAMLRAVNPQLAKEITLDGVQASQQIVQRVESDFVNMLAGMPPRLTPDDNPTAGMELQVAEGILQNNQKMMQAFQTDPDFNEKATKWLDNRRFNVAQNQNKATGRTGVEQAA